VSLPTPAWQHLGYNFRSEKLLFYSMFSFCFLGPNCTKLKWNKISYDFKRFKTLIIICIYRKWLLIENIKTPEVVQNSFTGTFALHKPVHLSEVYLQPYRMLP
jgi:hypothetical protein